MTVLYYVGITRWDSSALINSGLFAVQLNDVSGVLTPDSDSPVRLTLPSDIGIAGLNPNRAQHGSFSSAGLQTRLALVAGSETASVLMTVSVNRPPTASLAPSITLPTAGALLPPSTTISGSCI